MPTHRESLLSHTHGLRAARGARPLFGRKLPLRLHNLLICTVSLENKQRSTMVPAAARAHLELRREIKLGREIKNGVFV